jgi:hypothetical protein
LYRSNAEDAERIRAVVLYDYVSDDFSTDDGTESDEDYMEAREGTPEDATSENDDCCNELDATDNCFH